MSAEAPHRECDSLNLQSWCGNWWKCDHAIISDNDVTEGWRVKVCFRQSI